MIEHPEVVVLAHLDWDHTGGLAGFRHAEVLIHQPELDFARTRLGRLRYLPTSWPAGFAPAPFRLDPEPFGPFSSSARLTRAGDLVAVPIPGHSPAAQQRHSQGMTEGFSICDEFLALEEAVNRSHDISGNGVRRGYEQLGDSVPFAGPVHARIDASHHDGAGSYRALKFFDDCSCFRYVGAEVTVG